MTTTSRAVLGALGERLAVDHLQSRGLTVLDRNWRCRYGELDVVAADPGTDALVFVEVKTRRSEHFGGVEQAVTPQKLRRVRRLAVLWLAARGGGRSWSQVRVDVIGIQFGPANGPRIVHLEAVG